MPETNLEGASTVAHKLRRILMSPPIVIHERPLKVTVSIGVTALETRRDLSNTAPLDLLRAADLALYTSKRSGKDKVTSALAGCS
jgi:diguanylate cyclase (GGDEF)-like protein